MAITSPENCATFTAPASVSVTAFATDKTGTIAKIEFYHGATKLGEATTAPYSLTWNNVAVGSYAITAKGSTKRGATASLSCEAHRPERWPDQGRDCRFNRGTEQKGRCAARQKENTKEKAHDGKINTRWANDGMLATAWIQYGLGQAQPVAAVKIRPYNGRTMTYPIKIEVGDGDGDDDGLERQHGMVGEDTADL